MMKRFILPAMAMMAMGTFAAAESYPTQGAQSYNSLYGADSSLTYSNKAYVGLGYSYMSFKDELRYRNEKDDLDLTGNAITLLGGYSINRYFAVEGRYSRSIGDVSISDISVGSSLNGMDIPVPGMDFDGDMQNIALYLKPMYTTPKVAIYGLLGFGQFKMEADGVNDDFSENALQWGFGVMFSSGEHLNIYIDYIRLYGEKEHLFMHDFGASLQVDTLNAGLTYKF